MIYYFDALAYYLSAREQEFLENINGYVERFGENRLQMEGLWNFEDARTLLTKKASQLTPVLLAFIDCLERGSTQIEDLRAKLKECENQADPADLSGGKIS